MLISTPVQVYLAWRLQKVTESYILAGVIIVLSLGALGSYYFLIKTRMSVTHIFPVVGGVLTGYNVILTPAFSAFGGFAYAPTLWLTSAAAADVVIAGGLVWFLAKNKAGFSQTRSVVDKIIISTVQSGVVTSVVAVITLVIFLAIPVSLLRDFRQVPSFILCV